MAFLTRTLALAVTACVASPATAAPGRQKRERKEKQEVATDDWVNPRNRELPARHRFRLGIEVWYVRLTAAVDFEGNTDRFHLAPIGLDAAYQLRFAKFLMVRPSFSVGVNAANSNTAMPIHIHPKLHVGYQRPLLGIGFGYGYFTPVFFQANVEDPVRGGLGQPISLHNHHIDLELSFTTRLDRGALSFMARGGLVNTKVWHFDINGKRRWRPMLTFNAGWYFGTTKAGRERRKARQRERADQ